MPNFMGKDGFVWWQGVVEDRHDPLYLGRCRIRILGWHTDNKSDMPSESLPWAYPVQPIYSAAQTGVGISPTGPVEGTWVVGFFRDGEEAQEPVFFGTLGGIPEAPSEANKGFNDPRLDFDEVHPLKKPAKTKELKYSPSSELNQIPYSPKKITHYKGSTKLPSATANTEPEHMRIISTKTGVVGPKESSMKVVLEEWETRSTYPRSDALNQPTTPRLARGVFGQFPLDISEGIIGQKKQWRDALTPSGFSTAQVKTRASSLDPSKDINYVDKWFEPDPETIYAARYPYNHVHQSESGHIIEIDDTPGAERLHRYHRTGTFEEIDSLGKRITKVVNEDFHIGLSNDYKAVIGNQYENISGKLDVVSKRGYFHDCASGVFSMNTGGGIKMSTLGDFIASGESVTIDAGKGNITLRAHSITQIVDTAENTNEVKGNSTQKVGGRMSFRTGSLALASRGSSGITAGGDINFTATGSMQTSIANIGLPPASTAYGCSAVIGDISFSTALLGLGNFNVDVGPLGAMSSISATNTGTIELKSLLGLGGAISISATGVEISYLGGLSKISVGPAGVEISGLTCTLGSSSSVTTTVEGTITSVKGTGITSVEGALVKLN